MVSPFSAAAHRSFTMAPGGGSVSSSSPLFFTPHSSPLSIRLHRSSPIPTLNLPIRSARFASTTSPRPPPPPPESDSSGTDNGNPSTGLAANVSKSQESARIFLAVFFWLSLFFWASAWDGRNNGGPSKGSQFRR